MPSEYVWANQFNGQRVAQRYPFSSTYLSVPYAWAPDHGPNMEPYVSPIMSTTHLFTVVTHDGLLGFGRTTDVQFPGSKVNRFEHNDRHRTPGDPFYAYIDARPNVLFFDGSVAHRPTRESNPGWDPNNPDLPAPGQAWSRYTPFTTEPPPVDQYGFYPVWYRFTRGGLAGIDFSRAAAAPARQPVP